MCIYDKLAIPDRIFIQETIRLQTSTKRSFTEGCRSRATLQLANVVDRLT